MHLSQILEKRIQRTHYSQNGPSSKYIKSIHLKEMISMCSKFFESPSNKQIYAFEQGRSYTFQNEGAARG